MYDPMLGRWFNPDPRSQFASPYVFAGNSPTIMVDPDGEFAIAPILIAAAWGAAAGAATYTASVAMSSGGFDNWSWGGFAKSIGFGAVSGAFTAGIGANFGATGGLLHELGRGVAHGVVNGTMSTMQGGNFLSGFASGAGGSMAGSALSRTSWGNSKGAMYGLSALSGGVGSWATGGDFLQGATTGLMVAGLNHLQHTLVGPELYYLNTIDEGYNKMWEKSFSEDGKALRETVGLELENGQMLVGTNPDFTTTSSNTGIFNLKRNRDGRMYVTYKRRKYFIASVDHTHPLIYSEGIGISPRDKNAFPKFNSYGVKMRILNDRKVYNYFGGDKYEYWKSF